MTPTPQAPERDSDNGQYTSDTREIVFDAMPKTGEPVRARDVADAADVPRTTANYHLNKLWDSDRINKKEFHEKRVVWWFDPDPDTLRASRDDTATTADA